MMLDNLEIEKNLVKLKDNLNNKKKSSAKKPLIKDNRIWTQKSKVYISNIIFDINRDIKFINKAKLLLNEIEDINIDDNNNIKKLLEKKLQKKKQKPMKVYKGLISERYSSIIKNIYNKINKLNEKSKELQKFNGLGLQHTSSQYYRSSRPKSANTPKEKIFQKMRPASASTCFESKMMGLNTTKNKMNIRNNLNFLKLKKEKNKYKTLNSSHRTFRDGYKIKKGKFNFNKVDNEKKLMDLRFTNLDKMYKENNKRSINLARLNDVYRMELNKNLNMYSPKRHLKDMKQIQLEEMDIRQEMFDINRQIDERINERCQGLFFKREYEKYILKNKNNLIKSKSNKSMNDSINKSKKVAGSFRLRANYSSKNLFDPKIHNIFQDNLNKKKNKEFSEKERLEKKKESLKNILDQLGSTLDIEPVHKYIIDESKTNRIVSKKKELFEKQKEYFPVLDEVKQKIDEVMGEEDLKMNNEELEECILKKEEMILKEIAHNYMQQNNLA
jgi:hypothetical protein